MVIKRSPGGESAGGGRSTSKSTCVVPAWTLTALGNRPAYSMSKFSANVNSDLGNGSFWVEIHDDKHVLPRPKKKTRPLRLCIKSEHCSYHAISAWSGDWHVGAVCFLAKISLHRPKTTFRRLTRSQAISQSIAFSSLSDQWEIRLFFIFRSFFCTKLPFPLPGWSKDLLVEKVQVAGGQLRDPPV